MPVLQSCLWTHFLLLLTGPPEGTLDLVDHWMCLGLLMVLAISALLGFCGTATGSMRVLPALGSPLACPPSWSNPVLVAV